MVVYYVILLCWFVAVFPANSNVFSFCATLCHFFQSLYTFSVAAVLETSLIWCVYEMQQLYLLSDVYAELQTEHL